MADSQDFEIKIRVNADTTQVESIRQSFQRLGAQVQVTNVEAAKAAAATAGAGAGNAAELGRLIGQFTGVGIAGGVLALVSGLKQASAEIIKIADGLDKQGEELLKHAQLQGEAARHAKDQSDILKISDATLKDIESSQKKANELAGQEVGFWASISDYLQKQLLARQRAAQLGDYEAAQQRNQQTAFDQLQAARAQGMREVLAAEKAINSTLQEKVATVEREIAAEEKSKQVAASNTDPGGYVKAANNLAKLRNEREKLAALEEQERQKQEQAQDKAYGAASPQAKAILENEKAARQYRAAGDDATADRLQKTADQFRKSATPSDLAAVQAVTDSYGKTARPGRVAGVGESQDLVDEQERNRIAAEAQAKLVDQNQMPAGGKYDPRAAEIERQTQNANTERAGVQSKDTSNQQILDYMKSVWGN